jgi:hypothetical protein
MPRPRHKHEDDVKALIADHPSWGPEPLYEALVVAMEKRGIAEDQLPSPATIGRIKARFPQSERAPFMGVRFPSTFDNDLVPWAAAGDTLVLWRELGWRPAVRLARRFYDVTLAVGRDVPAKDRIGIAARLLKAEAEPELLPAIEKDLVDEKYTFGDLADSAFESWMFDWDGVLEVLSQHWNLPKEVIDRATH